MKKLYASLGALVLAATAHAGNIFVSQSAIGNDDGSSWEDAYTELKDAILFSNSGDSIFVAAGTYTPHGSDRNAYFTLKDNLVVLGGFAHGQSISAAAIAARDFETNETILSGDLSGNDDEVDGTLENSYHVVFIADSSAAITSTAVLDGFSITGGRADNPDSPTQDQTIGGGLYVRAVDHNSECSPTLRNLNVYGNFARFGAGIALRSVVGISGGAFNAAEINSTLEDIAVWDNRADSSSASAGGGILIECVPGDANITINGAFIAGNVSAGSSGIGGGLVVRAAGTTDLLDGATCEVEVNNAVFCHNYAELWGDAIKVHAGQSNGDLGTSNVVFNNVTVASDQHNGFNPIVYDQEGQGQMAVNWFNSIIYSNKFNLVRRDAGTEFATYNNMVMYGDDLIKTGWDSDYGSDVGPINEGKPLFVDLAECDIDLQAGSPGLGEGLDGYGDNIGASQRVPFTLTVPQGPVTACAGSGEMELDFDATGSGELSFYVYSSDSMVVHHDSVDVNLDLGLITFAPGDKFGPAWIYVALYSDEEQEALLDSFQVSLNFTPVVDSIEWEAQSNATWCGNLVFASDSGATFGSIKTYLNEGSNSYTGTYFCEQPNQGIVFQNVENYVRLNVDGCWSDTVRFTRDSIIPISYTEPNWDDSYCSGDTAIRDIVFHTVNNATAQWSWELPFNAGWTVDTSNIGFEIVDDTIARWTFIALDTLSEGTFGFHPVVTDEQNLSQMFSANFELVQTPIFTYTYEEMGTDLYAVWAEMVSPLNYQTRFSVDSIDFVEYASFDWGQFGEGSTPIYITNYVSSFDQCPVVDTIVIVKEVEEPIDTTVNNSIYEHVALELSMYPNPTSDQFTIAGTDEGGFVVVMDPLGQAVRSERRTTLTNAVVDMSHLAAGTYTVLVSGKDWVYRGVLFKE